MIIITEVNRQIYNLLNKTSLTSSLIGNPISAFITTILVYLFVVISIYESCKYIAIKYGLMEQPGKEFFIDKPVHCAHVYVRLNLALTRNYYAKDAKFLFKKPIVYNLEFGPMDYDERNPDLGTTLGFTKMKVLALFKNSKYYNDHEELKGLTSADLKFYHHKQLLTKDDEFLCLLNVETGHKVDCFIDLN